MTSPTPVAGPRHLPDRKGWQIPDYVHYLAPYADRIKKNHARWLKSRTDAERKAIEGQNRDLLSFCTTAMSRIPKMRAEAEIISDLHFGLKYASDLEVLVYLHSIEPKFLFLNGDIIDDLVMKNRHDLNPIQRAAIRRIKELKRDGCEVVRLRGNHDLLERRGNGDTGMGGIPVYNDVMFIDSGGKRSLITHGHRFDKIVGSHGKLEKLGGLAYEGLVIFNHFHKKLSRLLRVPHWSIARFCKSTSKRICMALSHYDDLVFAVAEKVDADYILCGHTHIEMHEERGGRQYINSADWVETCAALRKMPGEPWKLIKPMQRQDSRHFVHQKQQRTGNVPRRRVEIPEQATRALDPVLLGLGRHMALCK